MIGPFIRLTGFVPDINCCTYTVMCAAKPSVCDVPTLAWSASGGSPTTAEATFLDNFCEWNFWRFELSIPVAEDQQTVEYWINGDKQTANTFYLPGLDQPWHWAYYSCNGFTPDVDRKDAEGKWGGITPLWEDLISQHKACPMHALVGGGDQLYNDDVLACPALQRFFEEAPETRVGMEFAEDMQEEVSDYYFHHYAVHWGYSAIGEGMRSIPSVMSWDDHDIFDGWGSYPEELQNSTVFQGMYRTSRRFYLLFQMHTTPALANTHGCFGKSAYNQLVLLGPRLALALPDCRAQRTDTQVLSLDTHMNFILKTNDLPSTVRHLILGTTVPIVYPHLKGAEPVLKTMQSLNKNPFIAKVFKLTGITKAVFNDMGEPELLDDLTDHWTGENHADERRFLIEHLQMLAKAKKLRISIISGDVHLAATGRLYSYPKMKDLSMDFRYMPQIVCSAIGNAPPPDGLVTFLHLMGRAGFVNKFTKNKMCKLFDCSGKFRMLNRRNWCEIWEVPQDPADTRVPEITAPCQADGIADAHDPGALVFNLRAENFTTVPTADRTIGQYPTVVPVLRAAGKGKLYGVEKEEKIAKRMMTAIRVLLAMLVATGMIMLLLPQTKGGMMQMLGMAGK